MVSTAQQLEHWTFKGTAAVAGSTPNWLSSHLSQLSVPSLWGR